MSHPCENAIPLHAATCGMLQVELSKRKTSKAQRSQISEQVDFGYFSQRHYSQQKSDIRLEVTHTSMFFADFLSGLRAETFGTSRYDANSVP